MTCEHGFIGACGECDGSGQTPLRSRPDDAPRHSGGIMTHLETQCPNRGRVPVLDPHGADTGLSDVCPDCVCKHGRYLDEDCAECNSTDLDGMPLERRWPTNPASDHATATGMYDAW